jgi:type IX secretion system PorP/SprF family membrane protein
MLNPYLINPAVAGSDGYTTLNLTARNQWVGFKNAPMTQAFSLQTRLLKRSFIVKSKSPRKRTLKPSRSGRVGLGGMIFNDVNGLMQRTGINFTYAYHIRFRESQLSFGLNGVIYQMKLHDEDLTFYNPNEPLIGTGLQRVLIVPDANFGVYWLGYNYYAGLSVYQLFESYLKIGNAAWKDYHMMRHYYLNGGYRFLLNNNLEIEPSVLVKTTRQFLIQVDVNVKLYYNNIFWVGMSYRTASSVALLLGLKADRYYFGYAFDFGLNSLARHTYGSHEFMISIKLGDSARRYRWLERY